MSNLDHFSGVITASGQNLVMDTVSQTGAYIVFSGAAHAGITVNFEGTVDGAITWLPIASYRLDTGSGNSGVNSIALTSNSSSQYYALVGAFSQIRIRSSAYTSGTLSVSIMSVIDADPAPPPTLTPYTTPAAIADGAANPTAGGTATFDQWFNGTTWDRVRNNLTNIAVDTSTARTVTGTGVTATNFNATGAFIQVNVTAVSGTTPTMVAKVQYSIDGGTNFIDLDVTNAATASITTTGIYVIKVYPGLPTVAAGSCPSPLPRVWRLAWTIGGTTPSFTFATTAGYLL